MTLPRWLAMTVTVPLDIPRLDSIIDLHSPQMEVNWTHTPEVQEVVNCMQRLCTNQAQIKHSLQAMTNLACLHRC